MKCYLHPEKDAVGVCVTCGRGACEACSLSVGGKIYCRQCVEKTVVKPTARAASITVASILFYIFGVFGIISSLLIFAIAALAGGLAATPYIGGVFGLAAVGLLVVGVVSLILSVVDLVAGHWLWLSQKKGGELGIILSILGLLLSVAFFLSPVSEAFGIIGVILNISLIILIAIGWETLK